jgi:L-rhamnose mutarotase
MSNYCRILDEAEILFYGMTECEAQDAALAYLSNKQTYNQGDVP